MDLFDAAAEHNDTNDALSKINEIPVMIMGSQTDTLFPVKQQRELAQALKEAGNNAVTYFEMDSLYGIIQNLVQFISNN